MRYFITGAAGFIGSHLADRLIEDGHEVLGMDDMTTGEEANVNPKVDLWKMSAEYALAPENEDFDTVFHLAAMSRIQPSLEDPLGTFEANIDGTLGALEHALRFRSKFVYAGSSCSYGDIHSSPYAVTKHMGEDMSKMYNNVYDVPVAIARFFNVYGPRQIEEGDSATLIGIFERQKREGLPLTIVGDGEQRRDFIHVDDVVSGLIAMSERPWNGEVFNLGTGINHSVNEVAQMFGCMTEHIPVRIGEERETLADPSFAMEMLNWSPTVKLEDYVRAIQ